MHQIESIILGRFETVFVNILDTIFFLVSMFGHMLILFESSSNNRSLQIMPVKERDILLLVTSCEMRDTTARTIVQLSYYHSHICVRRVVAHPLQMQLQLTHSLTFKTLS